MASDEKVRENRLRRMAERRGLTVHKSRRRDPAALDYGHIWLERWAVQSGVDGSSSSDVWAGPFRSLDELDGYFAGAFSPEREFGRERTLVSQSTAASKSLGTGRSFGVTVSRRG